MSGYARLLDRLAYARGELALAEQDVERANGARERARTYRGGLLSYGGSGSQAAHRQVQGELDRLLRDAKEAHDRMEHWGFEVRRLENMLAKQERPRLTRDDVLGATHIRTRLGWHEVVSVNSTTVSVAPGHPWNDRYPFEKILQTAKLEQRTTT